MRATTCCVMLALLAGGCAPGGDAAVDDAAPTDATSDVGTAQAATPGWNLVSNGEGTGLVLASAAGAPIIRLHCPAGRNQLLVNVPSFRPVGSEERLSVGSGRTAVALVADTRGDPARGGVTGTGEVTDDIKGIVGGPVSASYGAQSSGPHPAPAPELQRQFVTACFGAATAERQANSRPNASTSPCHVQDGELLRLTRLRAIGTEPFWGADIDGRCVTYSHPEDQRGTRVWTKFSPGPAGGVWSGSLNGKPFTLRTEPARCSDGMSDKVYDLAVELTVNGEQRRGCASPPAGR